MASLPVICLAYFWVLMSYQVAVEVGGVPIRLRTEEEAFSRLLEERYAGFLRADANPQFELQVELVAPESAASDEDVSVRRTDGCWRLQRGDFRAEWDPQARRGVVSQPPSPFAIDSVLRIVHTLLLAPQGGFLLHASSAVRNGKAFLFAGQSGSGKTTMMRMAPEDVTLLTDEISYVKPKRTGEVACLTQYLAYGTPFSGDLNRPGENIAAPIEKLFLLQQGIENRRERVADAEAARLLLQNILFFAEETEPVRQVFEAACAFATAVPIERLVFKREPAVWELIG